jgi:hypothetical protein
MITRDENSLIVNKKLVIFRILTEEINILLKTFESDKLIDESLLDNLCRLFIETQNILSKICPHVKCSNYMENFNIKNEVKFNV